MSVIFYGLAIITLAGLLWAEKENNQRRKWLFKPATSLLFLLVALNEGIDNDYSSIVFIGLSLCFWGDVFLIPDSKTWFLVGLVTFLSGHIAYILAFNSLESVTSISLGVLVLTGGISAGVYAWLRPKLGEMQLPVLAYVVVITVMVWSAWAVALETDHDSTFQLLLAIGSIAFYFSDLAVAIDKFVWNNFINRLWGLPLYYLAQFMLASSLFFD